MRVEDPSVPARASRRTERSTLVLARRWAGAGEVASYAFLALLLDGATLVGVLATMEEGPLVQRLIFGATALLFGAVALLFDYGTLAMIVNRTEIRVNAGHVVVQNLPLRFATHRLRVPTFRVGRLQIVELPASRSGPASHRLEIVTPEGQALLVDTYAVASDAAWFRAEIEGRLAQIPGRAEPAS